MKLAFFGEDNNSKIVLNELINYCQTSPKYELANIFTTRPKPKGRKRIIEPNPIEKLAKDHSINTSYYSSKKEELNNIIETIKKEHIELAILTSFGHILPAQLIESFPLGIINIHPSLLPQYRGATPVPYSILMGENITGVTIFKISPRIDNGEILSQIKYPLPANITSLELLNDLFNKGANTLIEILNNNLNKTSLNIHQYRSKDIIYSPKFTREDGFIKWDNLTNIITGHSLDPQKLENKLLILRYKHNPPTNPFSAIYDLHRALNPWPGIWSIADTKKGKLRIKLTSLKPMIKILIDGKPKPITWKEFEKYYL